MRKPKGNRMKILLCSGRPDSFSRYPLKCSVNSPFPIHAGGSSAQRLQRRNETGTETARGRICHIHCAPAAGTEPRPLSLASGLTLGQDPKVQLVHSTKAKSQTARKESSGQHDGLRNVPWLYLPSALPNRPFPFTHCIFIFSSFRFRTSSSFCLREEAPFYCPCGWSLYQGSSGDHTLCPDHLLHSLLFFCLPWGAISQYAVIMDQSQVSPTQALNPVLTLQFSTY